MKRYWPNIIITISILSLTYMFFMLNSAMNEAIERAKKNEEQIAKESKVIDYQRYKVGSDWVKSFKIESGTCVLTYNGSISCWETK